MFSSSFLQIISGGYLGAPSDPLKPACNEASEPIVKRMSEAVTPCFSSSSDPSLQKSAPLSGIVFENYGNSSSEEKRETAVKAYPLFTSIEIDDQGNTKLHNFIKQKKNCDPEIYLKEIETIIRMGVDPNIQNKDGDTALHLAIRNKQKTRTDILCLLENGANPDIQNKIGDTPLHCIGPFDFNLSMTDQFRGFDSVIHRVDLPSDLVYGGIVGVLAKKMKDINALNEKKETVFHKIASANIGLTAITKILRSGANPNLLNDQGYTPLHVMAESYSFTDLSDCTISSVLIQLLQKMKVEIDVLTPAGDTALHLAIQAKKSTELIRFFIALGASNTIKNGKGYTPFQLFVILNLSFSWSINEKNLGQAMITHGATIDCPTPTGDTLLHLVAAEGARENTLAWLLELKADATIKNKEGYTPLHQLVLSKIFLKCPQLCCQSVHLLIVSGAIIDDRTFAGDTALHLALRSKGNYQAIECLMNHKADPNIQNNQGDTPLHILSGLIVPARYYEPVLDLFLQKEAKVQIANQKKETPLHKAIHSRKSAFFIAALLKAGANPNAVNAEGYTPLHLLPIPDSEALSFSLDETILQMLIGQGADVNYLTPTGDSVLYLSIRTRSDIRLIQLLLQNDANVNIQNQDGDTALHLISELAGWDEYHETIVSFLLRYGANLNIFNSKNEKAIRKIHEKKNAIASIQKQFAAKEVFL